MREILSRNSWSAQTECDNCHEKTTWTDAIITLDTRHHNPEYCELFGDFEHFCPNCAVKIGIHEKRRANFTINMMVNDKQEVTKWRRRKK